MRGPAGWARLPPGALTVLGPPPLAGGAAQVYFRSALGPLLLYRTERAQYDELVAVDPDADVCAHYGGHHLLRLFGPAPALFFFFLRARADPPGSRVSAAGACVCSETARAARTHGP